jgi:hypothetical protein
MILMKRNHALSRRLAIGASAALVSAVAPLAFTAAPASAAPRDHFTCRASALRVQAPPALSLLNAEPVVANRQSDPCASGHAAIANAPAALSGLLSTGVATATTTSASASGSSGAGLTNLTTLGLSLDSATASARYGCSGATATPLATSSVVDLRDADGMPITTSGPVSLPGGGSADVELNRTVTTATSVTRQAVQITALTGADAGTQIVIGEASAGISGNPCATGAGGAEGGTGTGGSSGSGGSGGRGGTAPVNTRRPAISGTPKAGKALTCSTGRWKNRPTRFAYRWSRNGTPIAGASGRVELVQTSDEGLSVTCAVTATNALGFGHRATSLRLAVKVPFVRGCPPATGPPQGQKLGLVRLGSTRTQARRAFTRSSDRGKRFEDFFCLTPIGVRVGYASSTLLKTLPPGTRRKVAGRVVLALTANAFYALHGVRPGATLAAAHKALGTGAPFHVGLNYWYTAHNGSTTAVLKVRHGIVQEIGIADAALTHGRRSQRAFIKSFS